MAAPVACELANCSLKFHVDSVADRMLRGSMRKLNRLHTRDVLADGLAKGGIERLLLHRVSNDSVYKANSSQSHAQRHQLLVVPLGTRR